MGTRIKTRTIEELKDSIIRNSNNINPLNVIIDDYNDIIESEDEIRVETVEDDDYNAHLIPLK